MTSYIKEKKNLKLNEFVCENCELPFWVEIYGENSAPHCPRCTSKSYINEEGITIMIQE